MNERIKQYFEKKYQEKRQKEIEETGIDGYCICCGVPYYVKTGAQHDKSCIWSDDERTN